MSRWITRALDSRESVPVFQVNKYTKKLPSRDSTLSNSTDWSPPGSSVRGIFQARVWSGLPCSRPGDPPDPGIEPVSFMSPEWAGRFSTTSTAWGSLVAQTVKNMPAVGETWVWSPIPTWVGKIPWRKEWLPTAVFLPREFHEQRSLVGYSPWSYKESDTTEQLSVSKHNKDAKFYKRK